MKQQTILPSRHPSTTRDPWSLVALDALCCWLIAAGVLLAMRQLFRFDHPTATLLLRAAFTVVLLAVLTRRWWVPLAVLGAGGALFGLLLFFTDSFGPFFEYASGLFEWWIDQFPRISSYNTPGNIALVQWLITAAVCAAVYLLVRRIRSFGLVLLLCIVLFIVVILNGFRENWLALLFLCAGCYPMLARSHMRRLGRKLDSVSFPPQRALLAAIAVCAAGALLTAALVPADASDWRNESMANALTQLRKRLTGQSVLPIANRPFDLKSSGLQPNADRLGGNLRLGDQPVMTVSTTDPGLMKGLVYDIYTGKGWVTGDTAEYVLGDASSDLLYETFGANLPRDLFGGKVLADITSTSDNTVTLYPGGYSLFVSGRLVDAQAVDETDAPLLFNDRAEVFSRSQLPENYRYAYTSVQLDRSAEGFAERVREIEAHSGPDAADYGLVYDAQYDAIVAKYTVLPDTLPASVGAKAREIAGGASSPYDQMRLLERYLSTSFEYTLRPGAVPRDEDFVDYFLKSGRGYCVYFASAMAVMARTLGVPSRFVTGYGLRASADGWTAYADTAHAWVEVYIRGVGWLSFDPTAGSEYRAPDEPIDLEPIEYPTTASPTTTTVPSDDRTTGPTASRPTGTRPAASRPIGGAESAPVPWTLVLALCLVLLAALVVLHALRQRGAYRLEELRRRFSPGVCADIYYRDILRQLHLLGLEPLAGETMRRFGRRASEALWPECGDSPVIDAFDIVMDWRYGREAPDETRLRQLEKAHNTLENMVRRRLGAVRFVFFRLLFAKYPRPVV